VSERRTLILAVTPGEWTNLRRGLAADVLEELGGSFSYHYDCPACIGGPALTHYDDTAPAGHWDPRYGMVHECLRCGATLLYGDYRGDDW
jgi:hypothetical protein